MSLQLMNRRRQAIPPGRQGRQEQVRQTSYRQGLVEEFLEDIGQFKRRAESVANDLEGKRGSPADLLESCDYFRHLSSNREWARVISLRESESRCAAWRIVS